MRKCETPRVRLTSKQVTALRCVQEGEPFQDCPTQAEIGARSISLAGLQRRGFIQEANNTWHVTTAGEQLLSQIKLQCVYLIP